MIGRIHQHLLSTVTISQRGTTRSENMPLHMDQERLHFVIRHTSEFKALRALGKGIAIKCLHCNIRTHVKMPGIGGVYLSKIWGEREKRELTGSCLA